MSINTVLLNTDLPYDYFLQEDVCRLCWGRDANHEFSSKTSQKRQIPKDDFVEKIKNCLDLDFRDGLHPSKACNSCFLKIEEFHEFKTFCHETDRRFKEILMKFCDDVVEKVNFDVKIEKFDNSGFTELGLPKAAETDDFLDNLHSSENSDCQPSGNEAKTEEIVSIKKKKYKLKRSPTYCNICRLDLETKEKLSLHNSESHGIEEESGLFKCFGCEKRFKSRKTRLGHEINFCKGLKDGYKCSMCERYLPKRRMYEAHMRDHREKVTVELPENVFQCMKCFKFFKTRDRLKEHMSEHDADKKNFVCEVSCFVYLRYNYMFITFYFYW